MHPAGFSHGECTVWSRTFLGLLHCTFQMELKSGPPLKTISVSPSRITSPFLREALCTGCPFFWAPHSDPKSYKTCEKLEEESNHQLLVYLQNSTQFWHDFSIFSCLYPKQDHSCSICRSRCIVFSFYTPSFCQTYCTLILFFHPGQSELEFLQFPSHYYR